MRLFLAVELPDPLKQVLTGLGGADGVRWARSEVLHLTLRFLGEVEPDLVPDLIAALRPILASHPPLDLVLEGGGAFPRRGRPRVLWVGVGGQVGALRALVADTEAALADLGFETERRPYSPHITLGRVKRGRPRELVERLESLGRLGDFRATEVVLFESHLRPSGAQHLPLERFSLG